MKNIRNKNLVLGFQNEKESFDVKEICFNQISQTRMKIKIKKNNQSVTKWCRCGKCGVMDANVKRLCYLEVEALGYFII